MKRDFELIRRVMIWVEEQPANARPGCPEFPGEYSEEDVLEHVDLLIGAGLIEGQVRRGLNGGGAAAITRLTWHGHDFLDAAKSDPLWKKAFEIVKEKGGVMTFSVLTELLKKLALAGIGVP